jgi:peptidoglycan/xylan/chitin deacetylase (PgdA/CDA1 family)
MFYFIKTPWWLKKLYSEGIWSIPSDTKTCYLTFDDGPHPHITPFVLEQLEKYDAKASFFCIGNNVQLFPDTYKMILDKGHQVGNHTQDHVNGWKTSDDFYLNNIITASKYIHSNLFRPPYGRIRKRQIRALKLWRSDMKLVMWDVLSADFDVAISSEKCTKNVLDKVRSGSVIVFHDSEKAFPRLEHSLPVILNELKKRGYSFELIS